ncbi:MAG: hypothetical protein A2W03_10975 [Candidatus Aminicenantes bacterium RBG_16_63_16]|nr:MAG: hypothetical protein A2W03_10975 [Candidatus Aminicenantes bacterium RBG_16_63_16]
MILFSNNRRLLAAVGLGLLGLAGLAAAQTNISNSPWFSTCPRLTVDPAGNVHVVWAEFYTMNGGYPASGDAFYSKYNVLTQTWSAPVNLSNSGLCFSGEWYVVGIDSDPSGNVHAVYVDGPTIKLRTLSGGTWSAPLLVGSASGEVDSARIAVDAQGNIFVCWYEAGPGLVHVRARVGGVWEGVATLSTYGVRAKFPEIAAGSNLVYCVWMDGSSGYAYHMAYSVRARTFGAAWAALKRVTTSVDSEEHPAIKVDAADVAHIIYTPYFSDATRSVRYVSGTAARFSAPVDIGSRGGVHYPSLGLRGNNLYAVWKWDMGRVYTSERKGGVWSGEAAVPGSGSCDLPDVAITLSQDKVYYAWDTGNPPDIYIGVKTQYVAPTESSLHAIGDFDGDTLDEVAVDFGSSGLWLANDSGWSQLSASNPQALLAIDMTGDGTDELAADFGSSGLWIMVGGTWHMISPLNPDSFIAGSLNGAAGDELVVDFGTAGLWLWDGAGWTQVSGVNPNGLAAGDVDNDGTDELAAGFGTLGVWLWNSGAWTQLSGVSPDSLLSGDMDGSGGDELIGDFGGTGVWVMNSGTWIRLSPADAEGLVLADADGNGTMELLGDFGTWGLFIWINNGWYNLSTYNPERVIGADVDGDGRDESVVDFGSVGLWLGDEFGWNLVTMANAENVQSGDADGNGSNELLVDFGPLGLWGWYGGVWYQISPLNPD